MSEKKVTRKEREREFKKQEILDAAIPIFAKKGFKATTLDEIAEQAEFGKGTLYNYFASKEDIYKEIIVRISKTHQENIKRIEKETVSFYDFIFESTKNHMNFCLHNQEAFLLLIYTKMHHKKSTSTSIVKIMDDCQNKMNRIFISRIRKAIKDKEVKKLDPEKIIRLSRGVAFTYVYESLMLGELKESNMEGEARLITDILFNGIKLN